jgi:hypothetical protein
MIEKKVVRGVGDMGFDSVEKTLRGTDVPANGPDICLDDGKSDSHVRDTSKLEGALKPGHELRWCHRCFGSSEEKLARTPERTFAPNQVCRKAWLVLARALCDASHSGRAVTSRD